MLVAVLRGVTVHGKAEAPQPLTRTPKNDLLGSKLLGERGPLEGYTSQPTLGNYSIWPFLWY